ncbi:HprK-related kinase B [Pseudoponticoccus marisrubri]|uniref:Aldolase n=1 Tax=Pseudoponticoccus marisrubri TaxID=1685382 RepID=A0A0W7WHG1_9RHOB|nr:HprK-related kinase B [Pseudoponticoccus marisrubri]KUF09990.1 aldolase [Pseudoponticoccus marisrubri]
MTLSDILDHLDLSAAGDAPFGLRVGHVALSIHAPEPLRSRLIAYFGETVGAPEGGARVHLLEGQCLPGNLSWTDWQREGGKSGRKDAIVDLDTARLIRKVRSGVTFVQAPGVAIALGPLEANESTVINFINTQVLNACLRAGWQLAHAAAVTDGARTLAISGLSGGGKSTSILRMMELPGTRFLSNDRVLIKGDPARALGIPKHPRINPGTILGNPRLHGMLSETRKAELRALPPDELWALEDKHDLIIPEIYGPGRMRLDGPLTDFWVLNWSHDTKQATRVTPVTLADRPDLLSAIMKSPGPFYQHPSGAFEPNGNTPDPAPYRAALSDVTVCEVSGRIDFDAIAKAGAGLFHD